jgi:hypothetical protein
VSEIEAAPTKPVCVKQGMKKIEEDKGMKYQYKGEEEGEEGEVEIKRILKVSSLILHPTKWRM